MSHTTTIITNAVGGGPPYRIVGAQKEAQVDVAWTSNYATGGEAVTAAECGLGIIEQVMDSQIVTPDAESTAVQADPEVAATGASVALKLNTAVAEIANALTITGLVVRLTVRGR